MADYPTSIWTPPTRGTNMSDAVTQTDILDEQNAEIVAMQTELGTNPSGGAFATLKARVEALDTTGAVTFTPTFSNFTLGDGTISGRRKDQGVETHLEVSIAWGSTTAFTGTLGLTLPINCIAQSLGVATYLDAATRHYVGAVQFSSASVANFAHSESGNAGLVNATSPHTWAAGDVLRATLVYLTG